MDVRAELRRIGEAAAMMHLAGNEMLQSSGESSSSLMALAALMVAVDQARQAAWTVGQWRSMVTIIRKCVALPPGPLTS